MTTGIPALREWQKIARKKVRDAWLASTSVKALIAACPGAGKTLFTALLIRELLIEKEIHLAIVLAPTTNIQLLWVDVLKSIGIKATADASNAALRWRKQEGVSMVEDNQVLVLTYAQLARDGELIAELARRTGSTLLVGDEIHHADDDQSFGDVVTKLADECALTLALSGTPFNSTGGALALCDFEIDVDPITGKPIRRTLATHTYSYANAINERVCRKVEFIKVYGRGESTYRIISGTNIEFFKRITDLARQRKADKISVLLDPDGEFMEECARQSVRALAELRLAGDKKAAMLVVAKNKEHGAQMTKLMIRMCEAEKQSFLVQEIYNDTPKAHKRIEDLSTDTTDIVISVRMISEGVDVKRLRIGLFATDWMTRIFFIQFIGRFVRYEDRLDEMQFATVVIPAHALLLEYAREIEEMIESAAMIEEGDAPPGGKKQQSEFVESVTKAGPKGIISRGEESEKFDLAEAFYQVSPSARGQVNRVTAIKIAEELGLAGESPDKPREQKIDWSNRNDLLVRAVVKRLKGNGRTDDELFSQVQTRANNAVGIAKKDKLTAEDTLIRRHTYLQAWLKRLVLGQDDAA